jgi:hypothetical protein
LSGKDDRDLPAAGCFASAKSLKTKTFSSDDSFSDLFAHYWVEEKSHEKQNGKKNNRR